MRARDTLFARVLTRLLLNLALVAALLWIFYQIRHGPDAPLAGLSEERVRRAAAALSDELIRAPRDQWSALLTRHGQRHQAEFRLLNHRAQPVDPPGTRPPAVVRAWLQDAFPAAPPSPVRRHLARQYQSLDLTVSQLDSVEALWIESLHAFRNNPEPAAARERFESRLRALLTPEQDAQFARLPQPQFLPQGGTATTAEAQLLAADLDGNGELNLEELTSLLTHPPGPSSSPAVGLPEVRPEVHTYSPPQSSHIWAALDIPVRVRGVSPAFSTWDVADLRPGPNGTHHHATLLIDNHSAANSFAAEPWPWVTILLLVLGLSALFWLPIVRGITRPLEKVTELTEHIADGRFENRLSTGHINPRDEIGRLALAVNQMANRLQGFADGQRRFLGDVAHELCAPLARAQVALGILEQHASPQQDDQLHDLQEEVQQMAALVDELLLFTRTGVQTEQALETVALLPCLKSAMNREGTDLKINLDVPEDCAVLAAPDRLARAFGNLARNAQQHAREGGELQITARRKEAHPDTITVTFADRGPGVPEASLPQLFDPFYRPESSRSRETGGTGLGLAIVKNAIENGGGDVHCRNRPGGGLEIILDLPAAD